MNTGTIISQGNNIDSDGGCDLSGPGDLTADPLLGPLRDNGGPTFTHMPLPNSPAVDAISAANCVYDDDSDPGTPEVPLPFDQRGLTRPQGGACDIGAVESSPIVRGHRVIDCDADQEIATLVHGGSFVLNLGAPTAPSCVGIGVLMDAHTAVGDGSIAYDYTPVLGETVTLPYEGETYQPFAFTDEAGWAVPGEIADCNCDHPERGDLSVPGPHSLVSTPCSADEVGWVAGDKAAQCVAAGGMVGAPYRTSLVTLDGTEDILDLTGIAVGGYWIGFSVDGVTIGLLTIPGQTTEQIAEGVADAINADVTLQGLGIWAVSDGNRVITNGTVADVAIGDPGIALVPRIEVYNTDLPPDEGFVKILEEGDVLSRSDVGSCPAFHTVTTGPRDNSAPESLEGEFTYPSGGIPTIEHYNETSQPYCWPDDPGWFDQDAGIPECWCRDGLTTEDGAYSITVTPYDGELVAGEPTGIPGQGLTINFYVPEPSRWLLLAAGLGLLTLLHRVGRR